jgi:Replication initiator protein, pSAM2
MLCDAVRAAAGAVRITRPDGIGTDLILAFGAPQGTDVRPIRRDTLTRTGQPLNHQAVANYIAKYATKTLTVPGLPAQRLRHQVDIEHLRCPDHQKQMITTAWQLGSKRRTGQPRFRSWAHMLGYGGHFLTKSRRYSVTFGQLRRARTEHRRAERHPGGERDPGAAPWTKPSSWSSAPGPTPELAIPPPRALNSRSPPRSALASTKTMPHDNQPGNERRAMNT